MQIPRLELFDLVKLVSKINSSLAHSEEIIELGGFTHKEPKRNPFIYRLSDRKIEARGKFRLRQTVYGRGIIRGLVDSESEINLGYIFIETGYIDASSEYGGRYETLRLRIKYPLELKKEQTIPRCSVKILQEAEQFIETFQGRRDHIRHGRLVWVRKDLSDVLPSEWFLSEGRAEEYKTTTKKSPACI